MSDPKDAKELEGEKSGREPWTEKVTIADAIHAVGNAIKLVDNVIWIFERIYRNLSPGPSWFLRSFYAWLAIVSPWCVYLAYLEFVSSTRGETIWPGDGFPILTEIVIFSFCTILPIALAPAITHSTKLSYAECFFGQGLRVGGYSVVAVLVAARLFSF